MTESLDADTVLGLLRLRASNIMRIDALPPDTPQPVRDDLIYTLLTAEMDAIRTVIRQTLTKRFGPIPPEFEDRLAHTDDMQSLDCALYWASRAKSLAEVLL